MPLVVCIAGVCITITPGVIMGSILTLITLIYLLIPFFSKSTRPTWRGTLKKAIIMLEKARVLGLEVREALDDITAEARSEIIEKRRVELHA